MKPTHKLINAQVNKWDKCLELTTVSPEINQGIITHFEPCKTGFGSSSIWSSYYIVIIRNMSLVDMGKHSAAEAALKLFLIFSHIDTSVSQHQTSLVHILTIFPTLLHVFLLDFLCFWSAHWIWRHHDTPYFLFSNSLIQAFGTFVANTVYSARKANSLMDHFSKCITQIVLFVCF